MSNIGITCEHDLEEADIQKLINCAKEHAQRAYAPYSEFKVGAALLTYDNHIIGGCNVEIAAYPLTSCAEKTAICNGVSQNYKKFRACAITLKTDDWPSPCGSCRQILSEFAYPDMILILAPLKDGELAGPLEAHSNHKYKCVKLSDYLPEAFRPCHLLTMK